MVSSFASFSSRGNLGRSVLVLDTDGRDFNRGIDAAEGRAQGFGNTLKTIGSVAGGFLAGTVILKGIDTLTSGFSTSVKAATDLGESMNAVNKVFGSSGAEIRRWGDENANAFGLSQRAFQQLATPLGAMLKNTGADMGDLAGTTIRLTERASDMASVFNTDVGQALQAISAGLRGETDPLEQYGVSINAAKVEARALADTGKELASDLTDQEKATARVALIFEQTADVAGDFAATSGELANKTRIQAAETEELQAKIGEKLIPIQMFWQDLQFKIFKFLADVGIPALEGASKWIDEHLAPAFGTLVEKLGGLGEPLGKFIENVGWLATNLGDPTAKLSGDGGLSKAFEAVNLAISDAGQTYDEFNKEFGPDVKRMVDAVNEDAERLRKKLDETFARWPKYYEEDVRPATEQIAEAVEITVNLLIDNWDRFERFFQPVMDRFRGLVESTVGGVTGSLDLVIQLLNGDWAGAWRAAQGLVDDVLGMIDFLSGGAVSQIMGHFNWFREQWDRVWGEIRRIADSNLGDLLRAMPGIGFDIVQGLANGIWDAIGLGKLWDAARGIFNTVKDALGKLFELFSPSHVMYRMGGDIVQGLANGIEVIGQKILPAAWAKVAGILNVGVDVAKNIARGILDTGTVSGALGTAERWRSEVAKLWPAHEVDRALAVMSLESGGNPGAIGYNRDMDGNIISKDVGLMQINDIHGYSLAERLDPIRNLQIGYQIWRQAGNSWSPWVAGRRLGYYEQGTPYVPYNQLAFLHKGEAVLSAADNAAIREELDRVLAAIAKLAAYMDSQGVWITTEFGRIKYPYEGFAEQSAAMNELLRQRDAIFAAHPELLDQVAEVGDISADGFDTMYHQLEVLNSLSDEMRRQNAALIVQLGQLLGYVVLEDYSVAMPGTAAYAGFQAAAEAAAATVWVPAGTGFELHYADNDVPVITGNPSHDLMLSQLADTNELIRRQQAGEIASFARGTPYVPADMFAYLHQGEAVITAAANRRGGGTVVNNYIAGSILAERNLWGLVRSGGRGGHLSLDAL